MEIKDSFIQEQSSTLIHPINTVDNFIYNSTVILSQIMSEDNTESIEYWRQKATQAEIEIQRLTGIYQENQGMIRYLSEEGDKKQAEIKKIKQQGIMREKIFRAQKNQIATLSAANAELKEQLASNQRISEQVVDSKELEDELAALKQTVIRLTEEIAKEKQQKSELQQNWRTQQKKWEEGQRKLTSQYETNKNLAEQLKKYNQILQEKIRGLEREKIEYKPKSLEKRAVKQEVRQLSSRDHEIYEEKIRGMQINARQLQENIRQYQKKLKQYKETVVNLSHQNQSLQSKLKALSQATQPPITNSVPSPNINKSINLLNQTQYSYPSPFTIKSSIEDEDFSWNRIHYSCLLITKPHYMSPFLEVYEDKKLLKIYKSTRSGCFERSMGYYKHKFDNLAFEQQQIIDPISQTILESQEITHHSIILYGVKKSNKKYLMSKILVKLKNFLISKINSCEEVSAIYIKRSQEEQKNLLEKGNTKNDIIDIINKVIALGYKNDKAKDTKLNKSPTKKVQSKPKVRFFNFTADNFYFQIGTSSFTNLSFRQKMTPVNMLNNIIYSKLPDILQSAITQKYLILTVNPIVDLYEDCRNTLSTTFCRASQAREEELNDWRASPVREELSEVVRKKLDILERDNEQILIRSRKFEDQCNYYRTRFDQLQCRLKNLLNTHSGQTAYLKKSPVTLSYEKLLKFVHSVQSRSQPSSSLQLGQSILGKASTIYIEKQSDSVDAL